MEKLMQRENGFPVYDGPEGLPKSSYRSSGDLDFEDVFGGPPRRFSMQEVKERYSFGESVELEEEGASSGWTEKPVFGKESVQQRRRHQGHDFFDDIFKGGESCTSPRRTDNNTFGSNPASRIMSPVRTGPKSDPFATSLPAQFSLPAKLTKGMELPTFASRSTNGLNTSHSSTSLSRFSNQATRSQGEIINEVPPVYRHSTLSREASFSSEDSPSTVTSDRKYSFENLKKDTKSEDSVANHFHFSIYKWAGRGVPMLMTLVAGNNSKSKVNSEYDMSASTNERMESESSTVRNPLESLKTEHKKEHWWSKEETNKLQSSTEEAFCRIPEPEFLGTPNVSVVLDETRQNLKEQVKSLDKTDTRERIEKEVPLNIDDSLKYEVKHLHAVLSDEVEQPGSITKMKETKNRTPKEVDANAHDSKNMKKNEGTGIDSRNAMRSAATNSKAPPRKSAVKGKIREFVQIFNQETDSTHKADVRRRSQSSRWKNIGIEPKENEVSSDVAKSKENDNVYNVDKKADVSLKVNENLSNNETVQISPTKTPRHTRNCSVNLKKSFSSGPFWTTNYYSKRRFGIFPETLHWDSKISVENSDDFLEDNFMVEELSEDHEEVTQSESSEDTKAIDAKIRQWSVPKKGNIRSLLSTLQYVLWPESGWKAVPLVDLIEANSVKRAYQKALLRLHPDKLQQKGAAFHQKYTAEKVFDILQEAWDHFNTCSSLNV